MVRRPTGGVAPQTSPAASASGWRWGGRIVRDPKAFLMDEPLSNLDAKLRVQMRTEVAKLQSRLETTTVYVTHDQTEAMTLGDRVARPLTRRAPLSCSTGPDYFRSSRARSLPQRFLNN